jgi:hypothetical protein
VPLMLVFPGACTSWNDLSSTLKCREHVWCILLFFERTTSMISTTTGTIHAFSLTLV